MFNKFNSFTPKLIHKNKQKQPVVFKIRIYGDNILECERALSLMVDGIALEEGHSKKEFIGGNLFVPTFKVTGYNSYYITLFPGIQKDRWSSNVYEELVTGNGGLLSEGADALITVEKPSKSSLIEEPVLAIEFSSALPAGNNSWQRSGRALSFSQANIPYIYATEIGGNELDEKGSVKATRWPASALILSYILNASRKNIINSIHYTLSPVSNQKIKNDFSFLNDDSTLLTLVYNAITSANLTPSKIKILEMNKKIYNIRAKSEENFFTTNKGFNPVDCASGIKKQHLTWNKKVSIETSNSFTKLKKLLTEFCYSPYSKVSLPFGILPAENIDDFVAKLETIYPASKVSDIKEKLFHTNSDIVFALVNGFKPGGEDSRPDRGVIPFIRMLLGSDIPMVVVLFGPVPTYHLDKFHKSNFSELANSNGLFSAIFMGADYIIIDTAKKGNDQSEFLYNTIKNPINNSPASINHLNRQLVELPKKLGENDVDTLIHMLFDHGFDDVFESFSNPPGGDWSGISILKDGNEYRWISLPRAPKDVKRPDHIFQLDSNTLLSIESKDYYNTLLKHEENVGPHMKDYLSKLLFPRPINSVRKVGNKYFNDYNELINLDHIIQLTAATFMSKSNDDISYASLKKLLSATATDMVLGIKVIDIENIEIHYLSTNQKIVDLLSSKNNKVVEGFNVTHIIKVKP